MASIIVFEDLDETNYLIDKVASLGSHDIIARAWSISEAHELLTKMALGEVQATYTLLDGNLDGFEKPTPDFTFQPRREQQITQTALLGETKTLNVPMEPIIVPARGSKAGQHGRQISEVIRACNIPTTIIGISSDPAERWGGNVDYDLTKLGIGSKLLSLIESIETRI